jgi:hypothetical protein
MKDDQREIRRKLRILEHARVGGDVSRTCRYFGIGRASFYWWRHAYQTRGEAGLANKRSVPHNHPRQDLGRGHGEGSLPAPGIPPRPHRATYLQPSQ